MIEQSCKETVTLTHDQSSYCNFVLNDTNGKAEHSHDINNAEWDLNNVDDQGIPFLIA